MSVRNILLATVLFCINNSVFATLDKIEIKYDPLSEARKAKIKKQNTNGGNQCHFNMQAINDHRQNKLVVGHRLAGSLSITNLPGYLETVRTEINSMVSSDESPVMVSVKPKLIRMYTYPESLNINGVVALMVDFSVNGEVMKQEQYRGFYGKTNWANGRGEYMTAINDAMYVLIERYVASLNSVCNEITKG